MPFAKSEDIELAFYKAFYKKSVEEQRKRREEMSSVSNCTSVEAPAYRYSDPKPLDINDYEITKPFSIADIYREQPCREEFQQLLDEYSAGSNLDTDTVFDYDVIDEIKESTVLMRNLIWLIDNWFLTKKKQVLLEKGQKIAVNCAGIRHNYVVTQFLSLVNIHNGDIVHDALASFQDVVYVFKRKFGNDQVDSIVLKDLDHTNLITWRKSK